MFDVTISVQGERVEDVTYALEALLDKIREGQEQGEEKEDRWNYTFDLTGNPEEYFSLLVENIGWVVIEEECVKSLGVILALYEQYIHDDPARQVSVWSSNAHDPIYDHTPERNEEDE